MPRVQIDDQIIELTDDEAENGGYTATGMSNYQSQTTIVEEPVTEVPAPVEGRKHSTDAG